MTKQKAVEIIRDFLLKFTDPKPEYDGMTAYEMATKIADSIDSEMDTERLKKEPEEEDFSPNNPLGGTIEQFDIRNEDRLCHE